MRFFLQKQSKKFLSCSSSNSRQNKIIVATPQQKGGQVMALKTSEAGINLIKRFEGLRKTAYLCPSGIWTIGYGHTRGVRKGNIITEEQATAFLIEDVQIVESAVNSINATYNYNFNQNEFDALVSFGFNCGKTNLLRLVANGTRTIKEIADALLLYNKSNGKTLQGLINRRKAEQALFLREVTKTEVQPIKEILYRVKPNYNIRIDPSINARVIGNSGQGMLVTVKGKSGSWVLCEKGYISEDGFYDNFTV